MKFIIYYSILIILYSSIVKSQESCQTPQNEPGSCIQLKYCKPLLDLLAPSKPLTSYATNFLQRSFCGIRNGVHHICCSNRHTTTPFSTTLATPTNRRPGTITSNIPEEAPQFGKIENVSNHPNLNLLPTSCGRISNNRVSNGQKTSINELPFMALLQYDTAQGLEFACGGTIINERYILTAAHCVVGPTRRLVSVRVGEHVISTTRDCERFFEKELCAPPVEDIEVEEFKAYQPYNRPRFANDIAIIRLRKSINLNNSNMNAICLPIDNANQNAPLVNLSTAGWGFTEHTNRSDILLRARLPVVPQDSCQAKYGSTKILESQICAGGFNRTDTCQGDSGGPVFFTGRIHNTVRYVQYGVVAAGHAACGGNGNIPGLYTRIAHYMKWILDNMRR